VVLGMRVWFLLLAVASVPVAYWLARDLFGSRLAGVAAGVTLATLPTVTAYAAGGPREKTPMLLFMLLALWALLHRRWFLSGVLTGLATLTLQTALPPLLAVATVAAVWAPRRLRRLRALALVGAGGVTCAAVALASFAVVGHLRDFFDAFVLVNARYTTSDGILADPSAAWLALRQGYGPFLVLFLGGLLALAVLTLMILASPTRRADPRSRFVVAATAGAVTVTAWCARVFDSWPDTYGFLPFTVLGVGGAVWLLQDRAGRRPALAVTVVGTVVALVLATTLAVTGRHDRLDVQRRSVETALSILPGATITSVEAPAALVLAGQQNPTRYQMVPPGIIEYLDDTWPGGFAGFCRWLLHQPQQLVAVGNNRVDTWKHLLTPRYEPVGSAPGFRWFVDARVDPEVRERLHVALRAVYRPGARGTG
jgi:4-amino-4-deoxy-L-arabinose transferase-like glycosyltransferase